MAGHGGYIPLDSSPESIGHQESRDGIPPIGVSSRSGIRWDHIQNLDEFFTNVYYYHHHGGFKVIFVENIFSLLKFIFVVFLTVEITQCVHYDIFVVDQVKELNNWTDFIIPPGQCWSNLHPFIFFVIAFCSLFFIIQLVRTLYRLLKFWELRSFFNTALNISDADLPDMTWYDVQTRLLDVQKDIQICVHKARLDESDIYNRVLRHKNYLIAMINKSILPVKFQVPFIGQYLFLTKGYLYNLNLILFRGPYAPFQNYWHLRQEYKYINRRLELAKEMSQQIVIIGLLNLVLSPVVLLIQMLTFIYEYAERLKSQPGHFLGRRWSNYGKLYLRHFNELNHEFQGRTCQAYDAATKYLNSFVDPLVVVLAKNVAFVTGGLCIILFFFSILRETLLHLPGYFGIFVLCGAVARNCWNIIPDENLVFCPERLLMKTLSHVHYIPDSWVGNAHKKQVRNEFCQMFQYRLVALVEELLSPIITPLLLIFVIPQYSLDIVDFLRNFTVEVAGVGDVCSFALMDVRKHGHPMWTPSDQQTHAVESSDQVRLENGKTELSLMHFHLTNPGWQPSDDNRAFLESIRHQASVDLTAMGGIGINAAMATTGSDSSLLGHGGMATSLSMMLPGHNSVSGLYTSLMGGVGNNGFGLGLPLRGNVSRISGPAYLQSPESNYGLAGAMNESMRQSGYHYPNLIAGGMDSSSPPPPLTMPLSPPPPPQLSSMGLSTTINGTSPASFSQGHVEDGTRELLSVNMSASALYMHELHHRRKRHAEMHRSQGASGILGVRVGIGGAPLDTIEQEPDAGVDEDNMVNRC